MSAAQNREAVWIVSRGEPMMLPKIEAERWGWKVYETHASAIQAAIKWHRSMIAELEADAGKRSR